MAEKMLPEHLIELPDGERALWKCIGLRGAGFPVSIVSRLSAPATALAANLVIQAEDNHAQAKRDLSGQINAQLDALKQNGEWGKTNGSRQLLKTLSLIKADKIPGNPEISDTVKPLRAASERVAALRNEFFHQYETDVQAISNNIREIAGSNRFREAVLWQNRQAYQTAIAPLLATSANGSHRNSKQKQQEQLVANYLQRYCVKNDTIGFFGPVGWAEFDVTGKGVSLRHGENLVTARTTYLETWCIEALAQRIATDDAIKPWLKPIRSPQVRMDGLILHHPVYGQLDVPVAQGLILSLCDGNHTVREIAQKVVGDAQSGLTNNSQVYQLIELLETRGLLSTGFNISLGPFPEKLLRDALETIEDLDARQKGLASLDELESARQVIKLSAGEPVGLEQALENLETTFTRLTGQSPTREAGKMYAARTLVYEDCRRDVEVKIGADILNALVDPLSLFLISNRWFTFEFARLYRRIFQWIYEELAREGKSRTVAATNFWVQALPFIYGEQADIGNQIAVEFKKRWESLLWDGEPGRYVQLYSEELRPRVLAEFPAPRAGWSAARYHSPDILILAHSVAHINRGDYKLVMGECHLGANTLGSSLFFHQHPAPESLIKARELDLPELQITAVRPREFGEASRTTPALVSPHFFRLEIARNSYAADRSKALPISAFAIEEEQGELILRTWDSQHRFNLIELTGVAFSNVVTNSFKLLPSRPYHPRITVDQLIVSRESWSFSASDLTFAFEKNEAIRFLQARRWAEAHGIPRLVFTRIPVEVKPLYLDFDSPIYVDLFSKMVRRTLEQGEEDTTIGISEMLPGPDCSWLEDAQGQQYTSELRIVALDLIDH